MRMTIVSLTLLNYYSVFSRIPSTIANKLNTGTIARLKDGVAVTKLLKSEIGTVGKAADPPLPTRDYQLMLKPPRKSDGESKITGMLTVRLTMVPPNASTDPSLFEDLIKESHAALQRRPVAPLLLSYSLLLKTLLVNANSSKHKKIMKDILNRTCGVGTRSARTLIALLSHVLNIRISHSYHSNSNAVKCTLKYYVY